MSYNSRMYYTGNGAEQNLSLTYDYLDPTHVHVYLDGVLQEDDTWSYLNQSTVVVTAGSGVEIEIRRSTPLEPLVTFTNASLLNEDDQNTAALQALYLIQEGADVDVLLRELVDIIGDTSIVFSMDNGDTLIDVGQKTSLVIPFDCDIIGAYLLANAADDMVVDVWVTPYASYPPTDSDSITAAAPLTLSAADKTLDTTLTGWTKRINSGDVVTINVDSCGADITKASVSLIVTRA